MVERTMGQKLLAEFVGTFTVVFVAAGSIVAAGGGSGSLITIGIAYGLAVAVMVTALAHVSGAHLNPALTIAAWVTQKIAAADAVRYILTQLAAAAAAAGVLRAAIPEVFWRSSNLGTPVVNQGIDVGQAVLIEAVLTFVVVWVVFATAIDPDGAFNRVGGLAIGFAVLMGVMMGGPFTTGAMNPARWFGPALVGGSWSSWWVFLVGPTAGAIVAAVVYDSMIIRPHEDPLAVAEPDEIEHGLGAHGDDEDHDHP